MDNELKKAFEQVNSRFDQVVERIHDTETKLLKAFYDWAQPADSRLNKTLPALDEGPG